jgi:hypothetical protein
MAHGFNAEWWTLDEVALWIALRHPPLINSADFADLAPQPPPLDDEAEIFNAAANPPNLLDVLLAASPLLAEARSERNPSYEEELGRDLRNRLPDNVGPITLRQILDLVTWELRSELPSAGHFEGERTHRVLRPEEWLSLTVQSISGGPLTVRSRDGTVVRDVRCRRGDVLERFPDLTIGTPLSDANQRPQVSELRPVSAAKRASISRRRTRSAARERAAITSLRGIKGLCKRFSANGELPKKIASAARFLKTKLGEDCEWSEETIRQVISGRHSLANDLVKNGRMDAFWAEHW